MDYNTKIIETKIIETILKENFSEGEIKFLSLLKNKIGNDDFVKFINEKKIDYYGISITFLNYTLLKNYKKNAEYLIKNGANVHYRDEDGSTALYYVINNKGSYDDKIELINLLEEYGCNIDNINNNGQTLLMYAIFNKTNKEIIEYIINEKKANVDIKENQHGFTALMLAYQENNIDVFDLLLAKSNIETRNNYGQNILMYTINMTNFDVNNILEYVKRILKKDINIINTVDDIGWSVLMFAVNNGYKDIVNLLIEKGADINIQAKNGFNALMTAIQGKTTNHTDIAKKLININANLELKNKKGNTSLMIAIDESKTEIANMIIKKNTNVINIQSDNDGYTPLMNAIEMNNIAIVKSLIEAGADITKKNNKGKTAFMMASNPENKQIIKLLSEKVTPLPLNDEIRPEIPPLPLNDEIRPEIPPLPIDDEKRPNIPPLPIDDEKRPNIPPLPIDDEKRPNIPPLPIDDEKPISENEIYDQRLKIAYEKIKYIYDNIDEISHKYNTIVANILTNESDIKNTMNQMKNHGIDIKNIINDFGYIDNLKIVEYNKIHKNLQNYNKSLLSYENHLKEIENRVIDSYFYFILEKTIINNRNYQHCKNEKNNCGYLQLRIDLNEENVYKKIKIHGIFPSVPTIPTEPTEPKKDIFYDYDENIFYENFINFFKNNKDTETTLKDKFDTSFNKHLKYSNQSKADFTKNTIWLAEAFMSLFKKNISEKLNTNDLISSRNYIKDYFDKEKYPKNRIWGFINCFTIPENLSYIYINFSVCFNYTNNKWQFCKNNYRYDMDTGAYYIDGVKRKKSIKRKSIKRKSIKRKSIKRKSIKRKSIKRKSTKRKSTKRKSIKRKSKLIF
jgi:ankyrin repeat protein